MSFAPRIASVPAVALAATLLLGPFGAAHARPAPTVTAAPIAQAAPVPHALRAPHEAPTLTHVGVKLLLERLCGVQPPRLEDAVRSLCVLAVTMSLSPVDVWYVKPQSNQTQEIPPVDHPPPGTPPPPAQPQSNTEESPPPPPPIRVPEPATATSALIGASLAGLAWWRRRRRGQTTTDEAPDPDSPSADAA